MADAAPNIDKEGEAAGKRLADGMNRGVNKDSDKVGRELEQSAKRFTHDADGVLGREGERIGKRFGDSIANAVRRNDGNATQAGRNIGNVFTRGFARAQAQGQAFFNRMSTGFRNLRANSASSGNSVGNTFVNNIRQGLSRNQGSLAKSFSNIGKSLGKNFNIGLGAARMGEAIISILATAGPSLLSGAAAIGTALASEIVVGMAALGPGIAGALGVGLAAVSTLGLNLGLLKLAFSGSSASAKAFKKQFTGFKELLTASFAPGVVNGFSAAVTTLQQRLLPAVNALLAKTGVAMGNVARGIAATVTSAGNLARIRGILATNITFLGNFRAGLSALTTSFLILFNAAKPFVNFIGTGIKRFGEWAAASLTVSEANGNLGRFMRGLLASFQDLWAILKNFSAGLGNVFSAAAPAGVSLLGSIRGIADRFRAWTSNTGNMKKMTDFFTKAHTLASKVFEVLGAIFTAGGKAFAGMDLGPILHVLDTLEKVIAPAIARIFNQIQAGAGKNLVKTFDNIGTAITKIANSGNFQKVAAFMSGLFEKISELAASDFGSTILSWVAPLALMGGFVIGLLKPLLGIGKALAVFATEILGIEAPMGVVAGVGAAVAAALVIIWTNSDKLRTAFGNLWTTLSTKLAPILKTVGDHFAGLWGAVRNLGKAIGDFLAPIIENVLTPALVVLGTVVGGALTAVLETLTLIGDFLTGVIGGDWQPFVTEMTSLGESMRKWWGDFTTWFGTQWDTFWHTTLPGAWNDFTTSFGQEWDALWNTDLIATWNLFADDMTAQWTTFLNDTLPNLWGNFTGVFSTSWDLFWNTSLPNIFNGGNTILESGRTFWNVTLPDMASKGLDAVGFVFSHFWDTIVPNAWDKGSTWLHDKWDAFFSIKLPDLIGPLKDKGKVKLDEFLPMVQTWWDGVVTGFDTGWANFWSTTLPNEIDKLKTNSSTKLNEFGPTVATWWTTFSTNLDTDWGTFWKTTLPDTIGQLGIDGLTKLDEFTTTTGTWWTGFSGTFDSEWSTWWNTTLPDAIATFNTNIQTKLTEFQTGAGTWWTTFSTDLDGKWNSFWSVSLADHLKNLGPSVGTKLSEFQTSVNTWWTTFSGDADTKWSTFWGTTLPNFVKSLTSGSGGPLDAFKTMVGQKWDAFTGWLGGVFDKFWGTDLPDKVDPLTPAVSTKLDTFKQMLSDRFDAAKQAVIDKVQEMIDWVVNHLTNWSFPDIGSILHSNLVQPFIDTFNEITRILGDISGATNLLNTAKGALDSAKAALGAASAPKLVVPLPGPTLFGILDKAIPALAQGAIVSPTPGGSLVRVGEAGRPERVDPIQRNGLTARDEALIRMLTGQLTGGGGNDVNVNVSLGERSLEAFVTSVIKRHDSANARRVGRVRPS